jgi:hypothetical protein
MYIKFVINRADLGERGKMERKAKFPKSGKQQKI